MEHYPECGKTNADVNVLHCYKCFRIAKRIIREQYGEDVTRRQLIGHCL